jgi:hypothetical protein
MTSHRATPPTPAEPVDEFEEVVVPPEAVPVLAAAGVQALAVKLFTTRAVVAALAGAVAVATVAIARRALAGT